MAFLSWPKPLRRDLSCFLLPRWWGKQVNALRFLRLKNKLGNGANASSEVEFENARAWLIGEEGKGIQNIIPMVNFTRVGLCRHFRWTDASGPCSGPSITVVTVRSLDKALVRQPIRTALLADLALEEEASTHFVLFLAWLMDDSQSQGQNSKSLKSKLMSKLKPKCGEQESKPLKKNCFFVC